MNTVECAENENLPIIMVFISFDSVTQLKKHHFLKAFNIAFQRIYDSFGFTEVQIFPLFSVMTRCDVICQIF